MNAVETVPPAATTAGEASAWPARRVFEELRGLGMDLAGLRHVTSRDAVHERSGRRVLFLELREAAGSPPFLLVYLHRGKGEDFDPEREERFAALHEVFAGGARLAEEGA